MSLAVPAPLLQLASDAKVEGNEGRSPDVARIILSLQNGGTNLLVGLPVTVLFDPCPKAAN
jgi:hypothetical protein